MDIEKMISDYIENSIKINDLLFGGEIMEYKNSNRLTDKNLGIYARLITTKSGKEAFEKLLDHDNKYVRTNAAISLLNSGKHPKALRVAEEISKHNDKNGQLMVFYLKILKEGKKDVNVWNEALEKARGKHEKNKQHKIEKTINEFIENCIKINKMVYESEIIEYKVSNRLTDKNIALYAKLLDMNAKEEIEKLLDHENKYVRSFVAAIFLNSGDHKKALSVVEKISKNNDKHGRATKDYIKRIKDGKIDSEDWNKYIDKLRGKTTKEQEDIIKKSNARKDDNAEFELPIFPNNKAEEINNHFKNGYSGCEIITLKDKNPINKHLAIDINILTVKENPFYTVYTTGMSNFVMNVPKTLFGKYNRFKFAELVILIPLEWGNDFNTNNWQALFKLLRELAVYPHLNNTWINDSHTLEINMDKLNPNFSAVVLCGIEIMGKPLKVKNDNVVLNMVVPLYKEELHYIFKNKYYKLLDEISKAQESPFLLRLDRKSVIK